MSALSLDDILRGTAKLLNPGNEVKAIVELPSFGENPQASKDAWRAVTAKSGARVEPWRSRDGSVTIMMTGTKDQIAVAKRLVVKLALPEITTTVQVPVRHLSAVIGKAGSKVKSIQTDTMTTVQVPKLDELDLPAGFDPHARDEVDSDSEDENAEPAVVPMATITIRGSEANAAAARAKILEASSRAGTLSEVEVDIPKDQHQIILARRAALLRSVEEATGTKITAPRPGDESTLVSIRGNKAAVKLAKKKLVEDVAAKMRDMTTIDVKVKKENHKYIIGQGGKTILEISELTDSIIKVPSNDSDDETITIQGNKDTIMEALRMVIDKSNHAVAEVPVPRGMVKFVRGEKGSVIDAITSECNVRIRSPNLRDVTDDPVYFTVQGKDTAVESAKAQIAEVLAGLDVRKLNIPVDHFGHIIGTGGKKLQAILKEHNTNVQFPPSEDVKDEITVIGKKGAGLEETIAELERLSAEKAAMPISVHVDVAQNAHAFIIGPKGSRIKQVMTATDTQIHFPNAKEESNQVRVHGMRDAVEAARVQLLSLAEEHLGLPITAEVQGEDGSQRYMQARLKEVEAKHGNVTVIMPFSTNGRIFVKGPKEDVPAAVKAVKALVDDVTTIQVAIPTRFHAHIIGPKGMTIQKTMELTKTAIQVPDRKKAPKKKAAEKKDDKGAEEKAGDDAAEKAGDEAEADAKVDPKAELITVTGSKKGVKAAEAELKRLKEEKEAMPDSADYKIPRNMAKLFAVEDGAIYSKLAIKHKVNIGPSGGRPDILRVMGTTDDIEAVKPALDELVAGIVSETMSIASNFHAALIGKQGAGVMKIMRDTLTSVEFPSKNSSDDVKVTGQPEAVKKALAALAEAVTERENAPVTVTVKIQKPAQGVLAANKGALTRELESQTGCEFHIPPISVKSDAVKVRGPKDKVEAAKAAIEELVAKIKTEKVAVPAHLHAKLIGAKGKNLADLMNRTNTKIRVPSAGSNDDQVVVSGIDDGVGEAVGEIQSIVDEAGDMVVLEVNIPSDAHGYVIGPKGSRIKEVTAECGVQVKMPSSGDMVRITGKADQCEEAKAMLLEIVAEFEEEDAGSDGGEEGAPKPRRERKPVAATPTAVAAPAKAPKAKAAAPPPSLAAAPSAWPSIAGEAAAPQSSEPVWPRSAAAPKAKSRTIA